MNDLDLLKARRKLSTYFISSDSEKYVQDDLKRRYPHHIKIGSSFGDWGMGASTTYLAFTEHDNEYAPELVFFRYSNENNPIGMSLGIIEGFVIDGTECEHIRVLRDHLNTILGEGNSPLRSD